MVNIIAKSGFLNAVDTGRFERFADAPTAPISDLESLLDDVFEFGTLTPTTLSASTFAFTADAAFLPGVSFDIVFSGSGIGPISSVADFETALDNGIATGAITRLTVDATKPAFFPGDTVYDDDRALTVAFGAGGYTMTSGAYKLAIKGALPTSLPQFFALGDAFDQLADYSTLTNAQKSALMSQLAAYDIDKLSLKLEDEEVFAFSVSPTKVSLTLDGYAFNLIGSFPANLGAALPLLEVLSQFDDFSNPIDLSNMAGFSVNRLTVTDPDGAVVARTQGALGATDTLMLDNLVLDGVTVQNPIIGENTSNDRDFYQPGDFLTGTNGVDHIIGLAGHDQLFGGAGRDYLFGGSGNDVLNGEAGSDVLNPGDNDRSYDLVIASRGNDTIVYSDNWNGYQELSYAEITGGGITAMIDGQANTGSVMKPGSAGTDTIIDVVNAIQSWGFAIIGTGGDDTFTVDGAADYRVSNYIGINGGRGEDTFNITTTGQVRLNFSWDGMTGATQGARVNVQAGVVQNDGFGFADMLNVTYASSGFLELRGTSFNDRFLGGAGTDRFILQQGNDYADGKGGSDWVRYDRSGVEAVTVDLGAGTATGIWGGVSFSHTLVSIENARGSRDQGDLLRGTDTGNTLDGRGGNDVLIGLDGNDILVGREGADTLRGGAGRDRMNGGEGGDTFIGGGGLDAVSYEYATSGVRVDLANAASNTGEAAGDSYTTVEIIIGSDYGDTLLGDDGKNRLDGGDGDDVMNGRRGNDFMRGQDGDDTMIGGAGNDRMDGGAGDDTMRGQNGIDTFVFTSGNDTVLDFANDRLRFDDDLWMGNLTNAQILGFAALDGGDTLFDFGGGNTLRLENVTDIAGLESLISTF